MSDSLKDTVLFTIDNPKSESGRMTGLHFYYLDSLAHSQMPNMSGKNIKLPLYAPTILIEANAQQIPFLVYPGERINIRYAGSDSTQMYIQGNTQRNNEFIFFRKLVKKTGNIYYGFTLMPYHKKVNTLTNIHDLEKTIDNVKNNRLQFLDGYSRQFPVSNDFKKIAVNCIKSTAINDSLLLYYNNHVLLDKQNLYKTLVISKIAGIRNVGFMSFPMYDVACMNLVAMALGGPPHDAISNNSGSLIKRFDFVEKEFTGVTKDFLMANALYAANLNRVPIPKAYIDKFNKQCADKGYRVLIERKLNDHSKSMTYARGSNKLLATDGKTVQDLSMLIKQYKNKLILFDFWASWCGPCRAEMPYSVLLKKKYAGKKIAFIAISTDANINDWQKAAKEEAIGNGDSFLLLNADQASFVKHYKINAIPRYILVGKDGNILNEDTPRPSDPKLKVLIDEYL
ncbi:TlpA family protein disulfide reductase [Mucilaginibacter sp. BJC16-A38]|uniref:TlpA family protein disulfide reductase n=1 Tax=Mucilaginibacter phenanthrenivorans TaxID=1234842 RepID=UPI0021579C4C|nr:TlpA disulfide reductase family protein [Mucilaginibacter phenanthrenivorans]MCR8556398.1 TlpA family protein disulfide reductase [Mucilaginibacter phenanthrenivorans]